MDQQVSAASTFRVPTALEAELEAFKNVVELFKYGEMTEEQFRAVRVPMGIYEQRQPGTYVARVRLPVGALLPEQLRCVARVAQSLGDGTLHFSTRQDVQIHGLRLSGLQPALSALAAVGLVCKGSGGNTVRNVTTCCRAGICVDEVFDVAPYAVALSERLVADPESFRLPRKYKIAFSSCPTDCAGVAVSDLGFIARQQGGVNGFAVYVGGGLGNKSRLGNLLHEFIPVTEVYAVAESVKRVFGRYGDRQNKNQARLRFVLRRLGVERFREAYELELTRLRESNVTPLQVRASTPHLLGDFGHQDPKPASENPGYARWRDVAVRDQKQPGYFGTDVHLELGDLDAGTAFELADVVAEHGDGILRATQAQNLSLRWLTAGELPIVHSKLYRLGLASTDPPVMQNLVCCAGASTCQLGICRSRDLAKAISRKLRTASAALQELGDVRIHVSGCSNSCGRHLIADIGLHGSARRTKNGLAPYYTVSVGGSTIEGQTQLAQDCGAVPAKRVPDFVSEVLGLHERDTRNGSRIKSPSPATVKEVLARYQDPPEVEDADFHSDWGNDEQFSLVGRGPGECGAGPGVSESSGEC